MASARPIMEVPVTPKQTGVVLELSIDEARALRCLIGASISGAADSIALKSNSVDSENRDEYLEVSRLVRDSAVSIGQIQRVVKDALPDEYSGN